MAGVMLSLLLTSEVCALREEQQLQGLFDITEVVQHVLQVLLVCIPASLNKNEAGHLHCPACKAHSKVFESRYNQDVTGKYLTQGYALLD